MHPWFRLSHSYSNILQGNRLCMKIHGFLGHPESSSCTSKTLDSGLLSKPVRWSGFSFFMGRRNIPSQQILGQ